MATIDSHSGLQWDNATSLTSKDTLDETLPQGALVPDTLHNCDQIAVVYSKGKAPPRITVMRVSGSVHTVLADGIAVAVIASASRPTLNPDDVLLVERSV